METIDGNPITTETLTGVSSSFLPTDEPHKILKPSSEKSGGEDLPPENDVLGGAAEERGGEALPPENEVLGAGDGAAVVVTTTVIEKTEISIVKMIQEDKEDENKGHFGNFVGDVDENTMFVDAKGSFSGENGDPTGVEKHENGAETVESGDDTSIKNDDKKPTNVEKSETESVIQENGQDSGRELPENEGDYKKTLESDEQNVKKPENVDDSNPISEIQENSQDSGTELPENEGDYDDETEDHNFVVGDFVWGKIKSHPWWPGQIYDPSDASDYAATLKRKNHLLVAYFGDGSFSWCSPSQLKPFIEPFDKMSTQSDSKKFVNAVQKALEAVSKLVEAEMMCKCRTVGLDGGGDAAANSGIKAGVGMPKGNTVKILIDRMNHVELFETLKASATMDPGAKIAGLELAVLKSCLSAFYRCKGGQSLPEYHDPDYIEGLEDGSKSGFVSDSDKHGPSESGDGKLSQKRKQKTVAELLGEDEPKIKKSKTGGGGSGSGSRKRERKRKALVVSVTPESDHDSGGGCGSIEEETMSPRQRKKSKYLSPPYLSPIWAGKLSGSGSFKEVKTEAEKVPEMAAKHLEDSLKRGRKSRSQEDEKVTKVNVNKVLDGLLRAALDPPSFVEKKKVPEVSEFISAFRNSVFEERSDGGSDLEFIERKLVSIREMVRGCEEGEMSEEMKGNLEEGIKEVLEKVGEMK